MVFEFIDPLRTVLMTASLIGFVVRFLKYAARESEAKFPEPLIGESE
jgi:hypothetical protein